MLVAFLQTHPHLSYYKTNNLMKNFDAYQDKLGLSSRELRKVILRMPSLLGMSVDTEENDTKSALDERLDFFFNEGKLDVGSVTRSHALTLQLYPSIIIIFLFVLFFQSV